MIPRLPAALADLLDERWRTLARGAEAAGVDTATLDAARARWQPALVASDFAFEVLRRQPRLLGENFEFEPDLAVATRIAGAVAGIDGVAEFMRALRRARHAEALRLLCRSVAGIDDVAATLRATNDLYVALLRQALAFVSGQFADRHGVARNARGDAQELVVIGMGKLGGGEVNFSSDIDLILAYPEAGSSDGARPLANDEYFSRLARELVRVLAEPTADGIVARVDLRLRPFGQAGRLALSFAAMELYYQREGRDWERYAWIKANPVAGDVAAGAELMETLRPFVYRRYLDYTAFAGLREMKALIDAEVARKELDDNLKLGRGGIREIEFCVQLVQLIRGGREPALRVRGLLLALVACRDLGYIDTESAAALAAAYRHLRRVENAAQMFADRQTHEVASDARARVALALGFADWPALAAETARHRQFVARYFASLVLPGDGRDGGGERMEVAVWRAARSDALDPTTLATLGFQPATDAASALLATARAPQLRAMSARSARRLDRLMPELILAARSTAAPVACLTRLSHLVQAVARRSSYLALLDEQPAARERLASLCASNAFLADAVIAQPLLLDDVLDPRIDQLPLRRADVAAEIARALDSLDERHSEVDLERLNETRASLAFRLGLAFRDGRASAPETARRLAALAASVVASVLALARAELEAQHGPLPDSGFAVIGFGSLGSGALGFASDLDLVFVYDADSARSSSAGPRVLEGVRWYQRLAQRIVHWLSTPQRGGRLYEVDTRLRPDGSRSLLVSGLDAFAGYQRERAWTWEHQALLRARGVAGSTRLIERFDAVRREVLTRARDGAQTRRDVLDMRARWRRERDRSDGQWFDLKQGAGGLLDIDFLLQGLILEHTAREPDLVAGHGAREWIDAVVAAGVLPSGAGDDLVAVHDLLLRAALECTLDGRPRRVREDATIAEARRVVLAVATAAGYDFDAARAPQ